MSRTSLALSAALIGVIILPGCGGAQGNRGSAVSQTSTQLHDAIAAPKATELHRGMSVRVRTSILHTVGWQVACIARGRRVTAEGIRGQRTGSGEIAGYKGGPSIWVTHNRDGSITVSCR
jgi:hypothetical protein